MTKYPRLVGFASFLLGLTAPLIVLVALPFAKWDKTPSADSNGKFPDVIRGDLPRWASWYSTPDERLPGGTYEPTVADALHAFGRFWCSWYWLGIRNRMLGFDMIWAVPIDLPWPPEPGHYRNGEFWWTRRDLFWGLQLKMGWRTYVLRGPSARIIAAPCFTITR